MHSSKCTIYRVEYVTACDRYSRQRVRRYVENECHKRGKERAEKRMQDGKRRLRVEKRGSIGCNTAERYVNKEYKGTNHNIRKETE
jgi:hypothetical protein